MENLAVILLGSNTGDRSHYLRKALEGIATFGTIDKTSSVYESAAWGLTEQDDFLNMVAGLYTTLQAKALLDAMLNLERALGRVRKQRWGPRTIDLDLLYFGNEIIEEPDLQVPHPGISERRFTLVPLSSVYPDYTHPLTGLTSSELLERCVDRGNVYFYAQQP